VCVIFCLFSNFSWINETHLVAIRFLNSFVPKKSFCAGIVQPVT
jgi:hypothetical protein